MEVVRRAARLPAIPALPRRAAGALENVENTGRRIAWAVVVAGDGSSATTA
jgi:hypothetical protein